MKKIILLLLFFILGFNPAYCKVSVKSLGNTVISPNQISTSIQVVEDAFITLQFSIKVKALEQYISNTNNPQYKIPINQSIIFKWWRKWISTPTKCPNYFIFHKQFSVDGIHKKLQLHNKKHRSIATWKLFNKTAISDSNSYA